MHWGRGRNAYDPSIFTFLFIKNVELVTFFFIDKKLNI